LEKPYFVQKEDHFEFPHYQFPALSEHKKQFEPIDKMAKQYDEYFANLSTNPLPENQIVSMIGKTSVNVVSLNTLQPKGWLNDTILTAYLDLLGNTVYAQNKKDKNPPKMAVFDSHFLNNLGVSTDDCSCKTARRFQLAQGGKQTVHGLRTMRVLKYNAICGLPRSAESTGTRR
jgi:hypothetical protein